MARELPYFKFFVSERNDGDITLESMEIQGLFINICSYYWSNECDVSEIKLYKKFKHHTDNIDYLIKEGLIKEYENTIIINFLDEQKDERLESSKRKSKGGKASAEARRLKKLTEIQQEVNTTSTESQQVLNSCSTESQVLREEKRREEEIRKEDVDFIYSLYPSKDVNNKNRSTHKGSKDKTKIKTLLKTKSKEEIENSIKFYLEDCKKTEIYLRDFSTLLNNLPDTEEIYQSSFDDSFIYFVLEDKPNNELYRIKKGENLPSLSRQKVITKINDLWITKW